MTFSSFTPVSGFLGGGLIGAAAGTLLLFNSDILGASGIASTTALSPRKALTDPSQQWKLVFLGSLLLTTTVYFGPTFELLQDRKHASVMGNILAGLLVGFGTKLGNGCTTGHGICGLARLSTRSFAAVCTFMGSAVVSTYLTSESGPLAAQTAFLRDSSGAAEDRLEWGGSLLTLSVVLAAMFSALRQRGKVVSTDVADADQRHSATSKTAPAAAAGALFSAGLHTSGMIYPAKVNGFLDVASIRTGLWDPTLAAVMGGGLIVSWLAYQFVDVSSDCGCNEKKPTVQPQTTIAGSQVRCRYPLVKPLALPEGSKFDLPTSTLIDFNLVAGAALFGTGWGIGGLCPGPAILLAGLGYPSVLTQWWPAFFVGSYTANAYKSRSQ